MATAAGATAGSLASPFTKGPLQHLPRSVKEDGDEQAAQDANVDPMGRSRSRVAPGAEGAGF